jgi:Uma2 family endonuclease
MPTGNAVCGCLSRLDTPVLGRYFSRSMDAFQPSIPEGRIKLSLDEFLELPNDGKRYQILDGELDATPAPSLRHQRVSGRLYALLKQQLEDRGLGEVFATPVDVVLDRTNIVEPDLVFVSQARAGILTELRIEGAPDLIIEILSPSSRRTDVIVKSELYARFGVQHYWTVDPDIDRIEAFALAERSYKLVATAQSPRELVLEAPAPLRLPLAEIFK